MFHNANLFDSCVIHILYTGCAKIKKNNSGSKGLKKGSWILEEDALDRTLWTAGFGRGYGTVVKQTTKGTKEGTKERMDEWINKYISK